VVKTDRLFSTQQLQHTKHTMVHNGTTYQKHQEKKQLPLIDFKVTEQQQLLETVQVQV
jgi:uncharacterized protein YqjF (DUF2071 family)